MGLINSELSQSLKLSVTIYCDHYIIYHILFFSCECDKTGPWLSADGRLAIWSGPASVRTAKCKVVKVKLIFIGRPGSNCSAFYLYRVPSEGPVNNPLLLLSPYPAALTQYFFTFSEKNHDIQKPLVHGGFVRRCPPKFASGQ